jgi:hypothetical protein
MHLDLPRYVRKTDLARTLGVDSRRSLFKAIQPVAILVEGEREFELFEQSIPAAVVLNSRSKPE